MRSRSPMSLLLVMTIVLAARPARAVPAARPDARVIASAVDRYAAPMVARGDLSGQLLVLRNGTVVVERSWGKADAELGVPVTPETRFNIASVTKPMTVVLAIQQIVEGRMATRDSIVRWLPGFPRGDSITVGMLLRHRSGIPHEVIPDSEATRPFTAAEVAARAARLPLDFPPGSREQYSSGGFEVLARILEMVSGKPYGTLLAERILVPLGMSATSNADSRVLLTNRAQAYVPGPRGLENAPLQDFSSLVGAGSVWSTARDLHRFVDAVLHGKLGPGPQQSYAGGGTLDFNGRTGGFKAWATWDSTSDVEVEFLGNISTGAPDALKSDIARLVAGENVAPPAIPVLNTAAPSAEEVARMSGDYLLGNGVRLSVRGHDGALWANDWVLLPASDGSYFSPRDYGIVRGVTGADGRCSRLDWVQSGQAYPAPRGEPRPR